MNAMRHPGRVMVNRRRLPRQAFGLSDTLGAFVGGVLVAETDYRHQIEAGPVAAKGSAVVDDARVGVGSGYTSARGNK